jgi:GNAT superfamily N-acetyltransferase
MDELKIASLSSKKHPMLTVRPLTSDLHNDRENVLRVFAESPLYIKLVEGRLPSAEDVDDFFYGKPLNKDAAYKSVFGFYVGTDMVGCADVIRAYPTDDCVWIRLLLFSEKHQGRGYGKTALALLDAVALDWGCSKMRLAANSPNLRALAFWQREGFTELYRTTNPRFIGELVVMERPIQ